MNTIGLTMVLREFLDKHEAKYQNIDLKNFIEENFGDLWVTFLWSKEHALRLEKDVAEEFFKNQEKTMAYRIAEKLIEDKVLEAEYMGDVGIDEKSYRMNLVVFDRGRNK
jgi:hypothetical protein